MKLDFIVNHDVLIPRPDTELLVQEAMKYNKNKILDLCTGSGCIAVSLAKHMPQSNITATDISDKAILVANENAKRNNVNVKFIKSDMFENINEKFEMIISNPPYIKANEIQELQEEVKNEPKLALDGGKDGLKFYKNIANHASEHLIDGGVLLLEIGYDQAREVRELLKDKYKKIEIIKDLAKNDRVVRAIYEERGD